MHAINFMYRNMSVLVSHWHATISGRSCGSFTAIVYCIVANSCTVLYCTVLWHPCFNVENTTTVHWCPGGCPGWCSAGLRPAGNFWCIVQICDLLLGCLMQFWTKSWSVPGRSTTASVLCCVSSISSIRHPGIDDAVTWTLQLRYRIQSW